MNSRICPRPRAIAYYDLIRDRWLYWNATTQKFDLLETEPGSLTIANKPPAIRTNREVSYHD